MKTSPLQHTAPSRVERFDTVVIGGGQAGLAVGHHLAARDVDFVILSDESRVGDNWRRRWDSLRLFTPARYSGLPGMPFPAPPEHLADKDEVAAYLESYAVRFDLPVRLNTRVRSMHREGTRYVIRTEGESSVVEADNAIVATGPFSAPRVPAVSARLAPTILQLHSSEYRSPFDLPAGPVLVVGAGNSGAQIALELARTRKVWLAGRDTGHMPRRVLGRDVFDWIWPVMRRATAETRLGRRMRRSIQGGGDALIGIPERELQNAGVIRVGRLEDARGGLPLCGDAVIEPAVIIWCTGYTPDYRWIDLPVFDEKGFPRHERGAATGMPGLYFLGLRFQHRLNSSLIGGVGEDAAFIAERLTSSPAHNALPDTSPNQRGMPEMSNQDLHAHMHEHHGDHQRHTAGRVVVVELEAKVAPWEIADGTSITGWTFNGQVPGPTIEARVGDTVLVRLTNSLPEATTIHWHGLRIPAAMDGTSVVQRPVAPGETFEYTFTVPDAGTFWYHSHTNETVQVDRGLYGAFIVRGEDEPLVDVERVLVLDDVKLNRKGEVAAFGGLIERHNGREGQVILVNGREMPVISMAAGHVERWRIVNAANARYMMLSLSGQPFRMIASSGGLLEAPLSMTAVLLAPGDRVDLAVGPFEEGEVITMESLPYNRHAGRTTRSRLATVEVGQREESRSTIRPRLRSIEALAPTDARPTRQIRFNEALSLRHGMDFLINGESHHTDAPVTIGELQVWELFNTSHMDHPFHLHGFFFQVLSVDGAPPAYRSWEDTLNLPPRSRAVIAWMPDDRPGMWMYHCHILEHHAAGMMANFAVVRAPEDAHAMMGEGMSCHT